MVSDIEYEEELKNPDNIRIMRIVSNKFKRQLSDDTLENCCLHGLYQCIEKHDDTLGSKFTTSLYYHINFQCMRIAYEQTFRRMRIIYERNKDHIDTGKTGFSYNLTETLVIDEFLAILDEKEREMVRDRYLNCFTFQELARKYNCTAPGAKYIINKAIERMNLEYNKGENQDV